MHRGYIKLWRKVWDNTLYFTETFTRTQAWIDMLLLANHKPSTIYLRGIPVTIERGQLLGGENYLGSRWKWSRGKVRRFMQNLEQQNEQQIRQQKNNVITLITIVNYYLYQPDDTTNGTTNRTPDGHQTDTRRTHLRMYKNVKNKERGRFTPPSLLDVQKHIKEKKYNVDAESFVAFYESKGWMIGKNLMKDWRAAVVTWAKRNPALQSTAAQIRTETPTRTNNNQPRWVKRPPEVEREIEKLKKGIGKE